MKTLRNILLMWGVTLILIVAGAIAYPQMGGFSFSDFFLPASSSLLGVVSYFVFRSENRNGAKLVFLNFALLFGINGVARPLYQLAKRGLLMSNVWSDLYFYEYNWLLYFLLLPFGVVYLVVDHIVIGRSAYTKYFTTLVVVASVWVTVFYPFLLDAKHVYNLPDIRNFVAVRESMERLHKTGNANPTTEEIASSAQITLSRGIDQRDGTSGKQRERYVAELQQYIPGDNYRLLLFRPLFSSCSQMSLLCVFSILFYIAYQYLVDSPRGAYMEKIVWCLLPYCGFEALHTFAFTRVTTVDLHDNIGDIGRYLSMSIMWIMLLLFSLRLRFLQTVEGDYYERRLSSDASRITRWRDAFDSWILQQFMNPGELDRRFLSQRKTQE